MRFSILHRLLLVLLAMAALLGEVFLNMWRSERERLEEVAREDAEIHRRVLERIWDMQGRSMMVFADDYSRWDDMKDFAKNPVPSWIENNLDAIVLKNADVEYAWILHPDGREIARIARSPDAGVPRLDLDWNEVSERVSRDKIIRFFYRIDHVVIEIVVAGITETKDTTRSLPPAALLVAARLMDNRVMDRIHDMAKFRVGLTFEPPPERFSVEQGGSISLYFPLLGLNNVPVAWLSGVLLKDQFLNATENQQKQWLTLVLGNVAAFAVVAVLLWLWVGRPMNLLSESLKREDAERIRSLSRSNSELGRFAKVLTEFYRDKARLAKEVAERIAMEKAVREREELFRAIFDQAQQLIALIRPTGEVQSVNLAATRYSQLPQEAWRDKTIQEMPIWNRPGFAAQTLKNAIHRATSGGHGEFELDLKLGGEVARFGFSLNPVYRDADRKELLLLLLEGHDLSAYRKMEAEVIQAGEEERRKIGLDLHDGLCQELTVVDFSLKISEIKLRRGDSEGVLPKIEDARTMLGTSIAGARDLARLLTPISLTETGLAMSINQLALNAHRMLGVDCELDLDPDVPCSEEVAQHLFRITQEAIQNAVRHGKATMIHVELHQEESALILTILDNGNGVPPETLQSWAISPNRGLRTMRYRMRLIGGSLHVSGNQPSGLVVRCEIPLN